MNTNDQTRELATEARQHEEHLQEAVLNRAVEALSTEHNEIQDETRRLATEYRQQVEQLHKNVLSRAEDGLKS